MKWYEDWLHLVNVKPSEAIDWKVAKDQYGFTLLHAAARSGRLEYVQFALSCKPNVNTKATNESTPLHQLTLTSNPTVKFAEILKLLVDAGADVNAVDDDGRNIWFFAVSEITRTTAQFQLLEKHVPVWRKTRDNLGYSALHVAAAYNNANAIRYLLHKGADVNCRTPCGTTPMMLAAQNETLSEPTIKMLLDYYANVNKLDKIGWNALCYCAAVEKPRRDFEKLIKCSTLWELKYEGGLNLLILLIETGNVEVLKYFIEDHEMDVSGNAENYTLLHVAAMIGSKKQFAETVNVLVKAGLDINTVTATARNSPLFVAVQGGRSEAEIQTFLELGAVWNGKNGDGFGILHHAARWNNLEAFRLFISKGADVNAVDLQGKRVIDVVMKYGKDNNKDEMVKLLEEKGVTA